MRSLKIKIEETNEKDVACALATLAGFPKGSYAEATHNIWHREISSECVYVFHKDSLDKAEGDLAGAMSCLGPDILVSQIHQLPKKEAVYQPTSEYLIDFNEKFVNSSLVCGYKIVEAIKNEENKRPKP